MEQTIANVQSYLTNATRDGELLWSHLRTLLEQDGYEVPEHEDERIPTYEQLVAEVARLREVEVTAATLSAQPPDADDPRAPFSALRMAVLSLMTDAGKLRPGIGPNATRSALVEAVIDYREERISRGRLLEIATEYGVDGAALLALANTRSES
jgi:hypothetical protein